MKMNKNAWAHKRPAFGKRLSGCRRLLALVLASLMVLSLAACGEDEKPQEEAAGTDEWVWVPKFLDMGDEDISFYSGKMAGEDFYYTYTEWDEETLVATSSLRKYSLADGTQTAVPLTWQEEAEGNSLSRMSVGKDGSIWGIVYVSSQEPNAEGWYDSFPYLCRFDAEGRQTLFEDLTPRLKEDSEENYISTFEVDGKGRLYIATETAIFLYDEEGGFAGKISLQGSSMGWIQSMGCSKDGRMYICYFSSGESGGGYVLTEVDFDNRKLGASLSGIPGGNGFGPGLEKDFLVYDSTKLYEYDAESQTVESLVDWLDCDINGSYVQNLTSLEDGSIAVVIQDWETNDEGITILTKTRADEVVQKETIVIATMQNIYGIQSAAVKFNKSNDKYRISIKDYFEYDYKNYSQESYMSARQDAINRLNNDITSGNCPDIIDLSGIEYMNFLEKGVFEDLGTWLDASSKVSRSDFLENILEEYTYDGMLLTIPTNFNLNTVVGRTSDVGEEMGWSLDDIIAYADAHPDAELFEGAQKSTIMAYMMMFNEEAFIDWSTGECHFDSDEFKKVLEFVNRFPDEWDYDSDAPSTALRIQNGEVLLETAGISGFRDVQIYEDMFEGPYTFIGFPTLDGGSGCALYANNTFAITAKSEHKEGAWAFIEQLLTDKSDRFSFAFPTLKSKLEEMIEEETRTYYLDENGEPMRDENGDIIPREEHSSVTYSDGWSFEYHVVTQEEVDKVMELINSAKSINYNTAENEVVSIINEEAEPFYKGQKSADEVAKVIQSRIQIYVSTNS